MSFYPTATRDASRVDPSFDPDRCRRASFAREAVIAAFGRHARALDYGDFEDHPPIRRKAPAAAMTY